MQILNIIIKVAQNWSNFMTEPRNFLSKWRKVIAASQIIAQEMPFRQEQMG